MKKIKLMNLHKIKQEYPIHDKLENWFFRLKEISNGYYIIEGINIKGYEVSRTGSDENKLLDDCIKDAILINKQI